MRASSVWYLAAWLCTISATVSVWAHDPDASVVRVRATGPGSATTLGTGVAISTDRIATACHVTRDATKLEVVNGEAVWGVASQVGSLTHDLCVLIVPHAHFYPVKLRSSRDVELGERVWAVGFERGGPELTVRTGSVVALYSYDSGQVIRTDAPFDFGASGGGLFDGEGRLVGLLAFKARTFAAPRFALPSEWLQPESTVATSFTRVEAKSAPSAFWERPEGARPQFLGVALREAASGR